jgi:acetyl-CoA synthetase
MIKRHESTRSQHRDKPAATQADHYAALHAGFRWQVDEFFNIAEACCGRWARTEPRTAIRIHKPGAKTVLHSYQELQKAADALSQVLAGLGVQRGDRVAIVMPQRLETAVAYMAVFQMGAVAMPLSMLFGPEALEYRLQDSDAVVAICDESSIASLKAIRGHCPALRTVIAAGTAQGQGDVDYSSALAAQKGAFTAVKTKAEEGAILIYTSGTTGPPKGALLPHRALIGNLPGLSAATTGLVLTGKPTRSPTLCSGLRPTGPGPAA